MTFSTIIKSRTRTQSNKIPNQEAHFPPVRSLARATPPVEGARTAAGRKPVHTGPRRAKYQWGSTRSARGTLRMFPCRLQPETGS